MDLAFEYYKGAKAETESAYPYTSKHSRSSSDNECLYDEEKATDVNVSKYDMIYAANFVQMMAGLNISPLSVAIQADSSYF